MRLWHYKLLPYLPNSQLIAQWRELNTIYAKPVNHILINYVYEYDRVHLLAYSLLVIDELQNRNIQIREWDKFNKYFETTRLLSVPDLPNFKPFNMHHNKRYLRQCFFNLQEKYDRGQKDFTEEMYNKLVEYYKRLTVS